MEQLPNGVRVFNATPHVVRFWQEDWPEPVEVGSDAVISATIKEEFVSSMGVGGTGRPPAAIVFVRTKFEGTDEGRAVAEKAIADGADVVVGSIIAAQTYPGLVVAMTPAPGYERVPPVDKRMNPGKFTTFGGRCR